MAGAGRFCSACGIALGQQPAAAPQVVVVQAAAPAVSIARILIALGVLVILGALFATCGGCALLASQT